MKTTKENILKECFLLFLSKGYDATCIPYIERVTKILRGDIFNHFLNQEDIFKQSADYFVLSFLNEINYGFVPFYYAESFYGQKHGKY